MYVLMLFPTAEEGPGMDDEEKKDGEGSEKGETTSREDEEEEEDVDVVQIARKLKEIKKGMEEEGEGGEDD